MAIAVVCPGCKQRFNVSDKFAGKQGKCPKCQAVIKVPEKTEEVVIHEPEAFGPKDAKGRPTLKPIARRETKVSPLLTGIIVGAIVAVLTVAWLMRSPDGNVPTLLVVLGAVLLAPPCAWSAYTFLRDSELEPYRGRELWLRAAACGAAYAVIWGLVTLIQQYVFQGDPFEIMQIAVIVPVMIGIGAFAAFASFDFDYTIGAVHYGMYLLVTVILRLIVGLPAI